MIFLDLNIHFEITKVAENFSFLRFISWTNLLFLYMYDCVIRVQLFFYRSDFCNINCRTECVLGLCVLFFSSSSSDRKSMFGLCGYSSVEIRKLDLSFFHASIFIQAKTCRYLICLCHFLRFMVNLIYFEFFNQWCLQRFDV